MPMIVNLFDLTFAAVHSPDGSQSGRTKTPLPLASYMLEVAEPSSNSNLSNARVINNGLPRSSGRDDGER